MDKEKESFLNKARKKAKWTAGINRLIYSELVRVLSFFSNIVFRFFEINGIPKEQIVYSVWR